MAPPSASRPPLSVRVGAYGLAAATGLLAALLAAEVPVALADPATYEAAYRMRSGEGPFRSVGQYVLACGAAAVALAGVAGLAVVYARTGRWRRTLAGAALALAALAAWRALTWEATGFDH